MIAFQQHTGVAAPLLQANINTDAIIPSREVKSVSKTGLCDGLFADWRYLHDGAERKGINPDFVLNQPGYEKTTILIGGNNFGCGSSREFAVWALVEYGIKAIIAPGFGSIFFNNCIRNGLLPVVLTQDAVDALASYVERSPTKNILEIDLKKNQVMTKENIFFPFSLPPLGREMLLKGLDSIDMTLIHRDKIKEFKNRDRPKRQWAYLS